MEVFKTLMQIFLVLITINIVVLFVLWRSTRFKSFFILTLHWVCLFGGFAIQSTTTKLDPAFRIVALAPINFFIHYTLVLVFAQLTQIEFPLKKLIGTPLVVMALTLILNAAHAPSEVVALPLVLIHSSFYFFVVYKALRYRRELMTFSLRALSVLYMIYAFHLWDWAYFYTRPELLAIGFSIAIAFLIAFAILIPAAIIERMSKAHARLEAEIKFKARLTQNAKMAALGEMAGGVAHEINNPLTVLSFILENIEDDVKHLPEQAQIKTLIATGQSTIERITQIVNGLLTFSKRDTPTEFKNINLQTMIQNTLALCSERMKNNGINLKTLLPEKVLYFEGRENSLSEVILNLLNNSVDAVQGQKEKWIRLSVQDFGDDLEFSITDSGPGVPSTIQDKIFQPFFTTKEVGQGTGLGLSITKGIIESHKGQIHLDTDSKYTRFTFIIPKKQKLQEAAEGLTELWDHKMKKSSLTLVSEAHPKDL